MSKRIFGLYPPHACALEPFAPVVGQLQSAGLVPGLLQSLTTTFVEQWPAERVASGRTELVQAEDQNDGQRTMVS